MKRLALALAVALAATGCSSKQASEIQPGYLHEKTVTLDDGRTVTCLIYDRDRGGALDCDWNDR